MQVTVRLRCGSRNEYKKTFLLALFFRTTRSIAGVLVARSAQQPVSATPSCMDHMLGTATPLCLVVTPFYINIAAGVSWLPAVDASVRVSTWRVDIQHKSQLNTLRDGQHLSFHSRARSCIDIILSPPIKRSQITLCACEIPIVESRESLGSRTTDFRTYKYLFPLALFLST